MNDTPSVKQWAGDDDRLVTKAGFVFADVRAVDTARELRTFSTDLAKVGHHLGAGIVRAAADVVDLQAAEIERLHRERSALLESVAWRASWMQRTLTAVTSVRDLIQGDEVWNEIDQLVTEEFTAGDEEEEVDRG